MFAQRSRAALVTCVALATAAVAGLFVGAASADITSGDRPVFVPISPCRLLDTRPATNVGPQSGKLGADRTLTLAAHGTNGECTIPTDATGLSLNVTAVGATASNPQTFLTFWGAGARPDASNLNPAPGQPPTPNAVNTPLSPTGTFRVYNFAGQVHVLIDINGYYAPHNHDDRYYTETEADALFAPAEVVEVLEGTEFFVSGVFTDGPDTVALNAPSGVSATVTPSGSQVGLYRLQLNGLSPAPNLPVVSVTAIGNTSPLPHQAPTRACSLLDDVERPTSSTLRMDIVCVGETDEPTDDGQVEASEASFHFIITG